MSGVAERLRAEVERLTNLAGQNEEWAEEARARAIKAEAEVERLTKDMAEQLDDSEAIIAALKKERDEAKSLLARVMGSDADTLASTAMLLERAVEERDEAEADNKRLRGLIKEEGWGLGRIKEEEEGWGRGERCPCCGAIAGNAHLSDCLAFQLVETVRR